MFCFRWSRLPLPVSARHRIEPSLRSMASSNNLSFEPEPRFPKPSSAEVTSTTSSQMIGVAALQLGNLTRQATFSVSLQVTGRSLAVVLVPFACGPRHCGQFTLGSDAPNPIETSRKMARNKVNFRMCAPKEEFQSHRITGPCGAHKNNDSARFLEFHRQHRPVRWHHGASTPANGGCPHRPFQRSGLSRQARSPRKGGTIRYAARSLRVLLYPDEVGLLVATNPLANFVPFSASAVVRITFDRKENLPADFSHDAGVSPICWGPAN